MFHVMFQPWVLRPGYVQARKQGGILDIWHANAIMWHHGRRFLLCAWMFFPSEETRRMRKFGRQDISVLTVKTDDG